MSTQLAQREMRRFLSTREPEVLSISGRWGVGKTFGWRAALDKARASGTLPMERYAYASAFGLKNIDDLKTAIFQATVRLDAPSIEPSLNSFRENLSSLDGLANIGERSGRRIAKLAGRLVSLILPGAALLIRNQIVCIDDIERTGAGLDVSDILGFVSMLREEKRCKVVLLLNEEGLGADHKIFRTYLEKVVDQAIDYKPTAKESAAAALDLKDPTEAILAKKIEQLGITNIRVITRIKRFLRHLVPALSALHPDVTKQAVSSTALLGWCVFEPALAPKLDYVKSLNDYSSMFGREDPSEEETRWNAVLSTYGYTSTDELDHAILAGLLTGGFDMDVIAREATRLHEQIGKVEVRAGIRKPWDILGDSFEPDDAALKDALVASVTHFSSDMSAQGLDEVMTMLRDLGDSLAADAMLPIYMEARKDEPREFFNLARQMTNRPVDTAIVEAFQSRLDAEPLTRDPKAILLKIDRDKCWNQEDTDFLSSMSEDDYYRVLRQGRGEELRSVIRAGLLFGQFQNPEPRYVEISGRMKAALRRIGKENPLNAMRVKPYIGREPVTEAEPPEVYQNSETGAD